MKFDISSLQSETGLDPNITSIGDIISLILPYLLGGAGLILLLMIIFSGFQFLTSAGDEKGMQAAKGRLTAALAGFIIIFLAYWIVRLVGQILGIQAISNIFGSK